MAKLGPGPHRSGDIASELNVKVESVAPRRSGLITKGMIYSRRTGTPRSPSRSSMFSCAASKLSNAGFCKAVRAFAPPFNLSQQQRRVTTRQPDGGSSTT